MTIIICIPLLLLIAVWSYFEVGIDADDDSIYIWYNHNGSRKCVKISGKQH